MSKNFEMESLIQKRNATAREAELNSDLETAIKLYEENIKENYANDHAYNRLMIIYRKLKKYKNELRVIKRGIAVFCQYHTDMLKASVSDRKNKKQLLELSNVFMKKSGLKDKKGNATYYPEPLGRWMKRKAVVEKKFNNS